MLMNTIVQKIRYIGLFTIFTRNKGNQYSVLKNQYKKSLEQSSPPVYIHQIVNTYRGEASRPQYTCIYNHDLKHEQDYLYTFVVT